MTLWTCPQHLIQNDLHIFLYFTQVPIVVATLVSAFVVFGMAFIIIRRKKGKSRRSGETEAFTPNRSSGGSKIGNLFSAIGSACASIPGRFKKKKSHDTRAYDVEVDDDNI